MFELVYRQLQENANRDESALSWHPAKTLGLDIPDRTYRHRLRQLLERKFLYEGPVDGLYFANTCTCSMETGSLSFEATSSKEHQPRPNCRSKKRSPWRRPTQLSTRCFLRPILCAVENTDDFDDTCANAVNRDMGQVGDYEFSGFRFASWTPSVWKLIK